MLYHGFLQNNGIHFGASLCFFIWYNCVVSLVDFMNHVFNEGQNLSIPKNTKSYMFFFSSRKWDGKFICLSNVFKNGTAHAKSCLRCAVPWRCDLAPMDSPTTDTIVGLHARSSWIVLNCWQQHNRLLMTISVIDDNQCHQHTQTSWLLFCCMDTTT